MYSANPAQTERKYIVHLKIVAAKKDAAIPMSCAIASETRTKLNILARSLGVRVADLLGAAVEMAFGEELQSIGILPGIFDASVNPCEDEKSFEKSTESA